MQRKQGNREKLKEKERMMATWNLMMPSSLLQVQHSFIFLFSPLYLFLLIIYSSWMFCQCNKQIFRDFKSMKNHSSLSPLVGGFHGDSVVLGQWVQFPLSASCFLSVFPLPHSMDRKLTPAVPLVCLAMWERPPNTPHSPPITSQNSGSGLLSQPIIDSFWLSPGMTIVFSHNRPDTKWQQRNREWGKNDGAPGIVLLMLNFKR